MAFTIIKKGQPLKGATAPPIKDEPKLQVTTRPVAKRREKALYGVVGHKHHKDGTVELLYSSVPESEASPWLKQQSR